MSKSSGIPKEEQKTSKGGRPPRPQRSVIQLRYRANGKVHSFYSITVDLKPADAMKRLQEAFADVGNKFRRLTDDPRW